MIRRSFFLPLLLAVAALLPGAAGCTETSSPALTGTVTWIVDGDSLEVEPHGTVRLLGIDCPERKADPERDRKFVRLGADPGSLRAISRAALRFNIDHAKNRTVTLEPGDPQRDRHGRLLAYVRLPDGRLLNRLLLEEGLAVVYRRFEFARKEEFLEVEAKARRTGAGMWRN